MTTTRLGLFVLGFLAATGVEAVRADEAYLCDGGRIVKVPFGKLDEMKRTDACIAGYYGLKIEDPAKRLETGTLPPTTNPETTKPQAALSAPLPAPAGPRPGMTLAAVTTPDKAPVRVADKSPPARAAAGTDFRNVILLNAEPGAPAVYRHER